MNKDFWVGRFFLVACSFSNQTSLLIFQNKHQTLSKTFSKHFPNLKHFQKAQHFIYVLTNENYYKVFLNDGAFSKYFQKPHKAHFQTKASDLSK